MWLVLGIIFIILIVAGAYLYSVMAVPSKPKPGTEVQNPIVNLNEEETVLQFDESYIDYLVFAIGGWKLHNPPLSSKTPKIEIILDNNEIYVSEIIDGEIMTEKKQIDDEDLLILTTKDKVIDIISSGDMENAVKGAVNEGTLTLELKAGYTTLLGKGYLAIYKDLTGETFTGSVIRIFGQ